MKLLNRMFSCNLDSVRVLRIRSRLLSCSSRVLPLAPRRSNPTHSEKLLEMMDGPMKMSMVTLETNAAKDGSKLPGVAITATDVKIANIGSILRTNVKIHVFDNRPQNLRPLSIRSRRFAIKSSRPSSSSKPRRKGEGESHHLRLLAS